MPVLLKIFIKEGVAMKVVHTVLSIVFFMFIGCSGGGGGGGSTPQDANDTNTTPIVVSSQMPVANAGVDRIGMVSKNINSPATQEILYLDGSSSYGSEFTWEVVSKPSTTAQLILTSSKTKVTGVYGNSAGTYIIKLTVKDAQSTTVIDNITVTLLEDDDGDGILNADDLDSDGDGFLNTNDLFPNSIASHGDFDGDGVSNYLTPDTDKDGVLDYNDNFPLDSNKSSYTLYSETKETSTTFNANDGISLAEVTSSVPLAISGTIYSSSYGNNGSDLDYFKANFSAGVYSVWLKENNSSMQPIISVVNAAGQSVSSKSTDLSSVGYALTSVLIPSDGDYYIMITDASGTSDLDWSYAVKVFSDSDMDGLPDDLEIAIDSNQNNADSDSDGISDFIEVYYAYEKGLGDVDGDGIPNWWDYDSENDGIPDSVEYFSSKNNPDMSASSLNALNDIDQDLIPNFLDTDSDQNGILDKNEAGVDYTNPVDTDGDLVPDYLDEDNDNDGIQDTNEASLSDMNTPIALAGESRSLATSVMIQSLVNDTLDVNNICMDDTNVTIKLSNIPTTTASALLTFKGTQSSINQTVSIQNGDTIVFGCPKNVNKGLVEFFVTLNGNERTLSEEILFIENTTPVIKSVTYDSYYNRLAITGLNLNSDLTVTLNGKSYSYNNSYGSSSTLNFSTYETLESGMLYLSNSSGSSNPVWTAITHDLYVAVTMPDSTIDVTSLELSINDVEYKPNSYGYVSIPVNLYSPAIVTAFIVDTTTSTENPDYIPYLYAVALPSATTVTLDTNSTAMAMLWSGLGVASMVSDNDLQLVMNDLANLTSVANFKTVFKQELIKNNKVLISPSTAYTNASKQALLDGATLLNQKLTSGTYTKRSLKSLVHKKGIYGDDATVTPASADGISVYERDDTGNLNIYNDTQMYLSARVTDTKGNVLQDHVSSYFSSDLVGPQDYGLLFWASTTELKIPTGKNCNVEIVTPGIDKEFDPKITALSSFNPSTRAVFKYLAFRTLVERVTWPVLSEIFGDYMSKNTFINIIYSSAPTLVDAVVIDISKGDTTGAAKRMLDLLWKDFFTAPPGPITTAIATKILGKAADNVAKEVAEKLLVKIGKKLGMKAVPVLGQISAAYEVAGHLNNGLAAAATVYDLSSKDSVIDFSVVFPVTVTSISPSKIIPDGSNRLIKIDGTGFSPIKEHFYSSATQPEITIIDAKGNEIVLSPKYIKPDGTTMTVEVPGTFLTKDIEGPLDVIVHHPTFNTDGKITKNDAIAIVNDVTLTSVTPSSGASGIEVTLYGSGFAPESNDNEVTFDGKKVLIVSASQDSLSIMIPPSLDPADYAIRAKAKHSDQWTEWSNSITYTVEAGNLTITVCDDGGLKDDAFALYVDNQYLGSMFATDSNYCKSFKPNVTIGSHTAMLQGIEAPDGVGTYSIDFGSASVSGASLSGSDLSPGVVKNYTFDITGIVSKVLKRNLVTIPYHPLSTIKE